MKYLRHKASNALNVVRDRIESRRIAPPAPSDILKRDFSSGRRKLRIVAHNSFYPLLSETYIGDELEALRRFGIDVVISRDKPALVPTPSRIDVPLYESLHDAISHHDPDLVLMHWATNALKSMNQCAAARVPYAVRTHSFDWSVEDTSMLGPWCIGIWHLPHRGEGEDRVFHLPTLIIQDLARFSPTDRRSRSILSVSAGLPKKNWPTLMKAVSSIPDVPLEVVVARTNGHEDMPRIVSEAAAAHGVNCSMEVDLPYDEVQEKLRIHGAFVYSIEPDCPVGQPRSIIESALACIPLVVPDLPGVRRIVGDVAHFYIPGQATSLTAALREALDFPLPLSTRLQLARHVWQRHASPEVFGNWATSLTDAYVQWSRLVSTGDCQVEAPSGL